MAQSPYDADLDRTPANFQPLTPLAFLQRCAEVFPDRTAVIHGGGETRYREFYARARRQFKPCGMDAAFVLLKFPAAWLVPA